MQPLKWFWQPSFQNLHKNPSCDKAMPKKLKFQIEVLLPPWESLCCGFEPSVPPNPSQVNKVSWSEEHLQFTIQLGYFSCFSLQIWAIRPGHQKWYVLSVLWMPQNYIIRFVLSTWLWIMSSVGSFVAGTWSNKRRLLSFYRIASWGG